MPCRSDHMEASAREKESRQVCILLNHFHPDPPEWVAEAASSYYGNPNKTDEATAMLCELCQRLDDSIIYNGYDPVARKLADWWDRHVEVDRKRKEAEALETKRKGLVESALSKITDEERQALGI